MKPSIENLLKVRWFLAQFKTTLFSMLGFIAVMAVSYGVMVTVFWQLAPESRAAREISSIFALPISVMIGAVGVFLLTPFILRWSWPVIKIHEDKELDLFFVRFGRTPPQWIEVASQPGIPFQAWATGLSSNKNIFRPAVLYTQNLKEKLKEDSVRAVFLHEISHLILNHPFQRGMRSLLVFGASSLLMILFATAAVLSRNLMFLAMLVPTAALGSFYTKAYFVKFILAQEFEADEFAVDLFGASPSALIEALQVTAHLAKENSVRVRALQQKYAGRIYRPDLRVDDKNAA